MADINSSTLYGGSVSTAAIYEIETGVGFQWGDFVQTEIMMDDKPRQLTRAIHDADPLVANIANPVVADFATTPDITFDGRNLSVTKLMYKNTLSPNKWRSTFPEFQPSGTAIDLEMNPKIKDTSFRLAMNAIKTQINNLHTKGDTGGVAAELAFYDGFSTLILADVDATQVGTPAVLSVANILAEVRELIQAVPDRLRYNPNLVTFCSTVAYDFYQEARSADQTYFPSTDIESNPNLIQSFGSDIKLVPISGMPANFMFTTLTGSGDDSNLVQGVWMESDEDAMKVYKITEADEDWRLILKFWIGVQYKSGLDIFYKNNV